MVKQKVIDIFAEAGITVNGSNPWDIQVRNEAFYRRLVGDGVIAMGESYVDGWWDCEAIDQFVYKSLRAGLEQKLQNHFFRTLHSLKTVFTNQQSIRGATKDVRSHYDLGIDVFENMLDRNMNYSGGYWKDAKTLDEAQTAKLDLICRKLYLQPGMHILDIGCGFGGFAKYAAEKYKVKVTGNTLAKDHATIARERCKHLDVEILVQDYREHTGIYDRIVSIGMIEHIGYKNQRTYFEIVDRCLKSKGLFVLQTIGTSNRWLIEEPWITKYVFPGTMQPTTEQITAASEGTLLLEDWQNIGMDYHKTLQAWFHNFDSNWPKLKTSYDMRFYRMWKYYLLACSGAFKARKMHLWQIVFAKNDCDTKYERVS